MLLQNGKHWISFDISDQGTMGLRGGVGGSG